MKATTILNKFLPNVTPNMHSVRRKSLNALLHSLILGADLSVTGLGRNIMSKTSEKHQIKRSMRLEESFRDLKTGLNFNGSNTRTRAYLSVLLLLAMLAQYVLYLLGLAVKLSKQHLRYQANSIQTKTVLSYQFIGLRAFKDRYLKLRQHDWQAAKLKIQQLMREPLNV